MSNSKIADNRKNGKHQAEELRAQILDAAEKLFLTNGIEATSMADISARLGISRVTLYRYFANRDEIAVAIHLRMLEKINAIPPVHEKARLLDDYREGIHLILQNYANLREAYRFIGMFDAKYLDKAPENAVTQWTRAQLMHGVFGERASANLSQVHAYGPRLGIILDAFTWFLEKLALRGELTWAGPGISLAEQLDFFEKMILRSFDLLEQGESTESTETPIQKKENVR